MRLLNSTTLRFVTPQGPQISPYAILSHTWGNEEEEVSFQELRDGLGSSKPGYDKIRRCGELAREHGFELFWVDTCCIDKSSSAELTEAINSMYSWYKNAGVCYAYLSDVSSPHPVFPPPSTFKSSKWFTRGWTLQELLAPRTVIFLSKEWQRIGDKANLKASIQEITGIRASALNNSDLEDADQELFSVAERMSWASGRQTTRVEDVAYSLMGLFNVNMPLLYGEKEKSFIRLQEEIMKISDDQSLFAWTDPSIPSMAYRDILARSPKSFAKSAHISSLGILGRSDAFVMTNKGLRVELFLIPDPDEKELYLASLDCFVGGSLHQSPAIYLHRVSGREVSGKANSLAHFARIRANHIRILSSHEKLQGVYKTIYVRQGYNIPLQRLRGSGGLRLFRIKMDCDSPYVVQPSHQWDPQSEILSTGLAPGGVAEVVISHQDRFRIIILGVSQQGGAWAHIANESPENPLQDPSWMWYQPTGTETTTSQRLFTSPETQMHIGVWINYDLIYRVPIFEVRIEVRTSSASAAVARAIEYSEDEP